MSLDEDEILAAALGTAASRRLKKNVLEVDLVLAIAPAAAAKRTRQVLDELGNELDCRDDGETPESQIVAVVPSGSGGLNPAVVTVTIRAADDGGSKLVVRGAAKEGLIRQRAGEAAARRVASALA